MEKKKEKDQEPLPVNEPLAACESKRMHFFNSFEEQENENYKWLASLPLEENLRYTVSLIKRVFADDLIKNPTIGNRINFNK